MPNGKTHDRISLVILPFIVWGGWILFKDYVYTLILSISYLFSAYMFNGDLDAYTRPYNRWWVFKMIWIPYQLMFHHRSIFTHGFIIGTVIRLLYVGTIPCLLLYFGYGINIFNYLLTIEFMLIFLGLELGNLSHSIPDWLT